MGHFNIDISFEMDSNKSPVLTISIYNSLHSIFNLIKSFNLINLLSNNIILSTIFEYYGRRT